MNTLTRMMILTVFMASISTLAETPINPIHKDYLARKLRYEERVVQARKEFVALSGKKTWRLVIDKPDRGGYPSSGEAHIELDGAMTEFAKEYTPMEVAAALWDMLDDPAIRLNAAAFVCGEDNRPAGTHFLTLPKPLNSVKAELSGRAHIPPGGPDGPDFPFKPYFSGFDSMVVQVDCRDNPARRLDYIEAIVKILADPAIRKETPLEVKNLLMILSFLKASEAVPTFVDYMFFDWATGGDFRIQEPDDLERMKYNMKNNIFGTDMPYHYVSYFGEKYVSVLLQRFANASEQERRTTVGGGATPIHAMIYFKQLRITVDQALEHVENFKRGNAQLNDEQKAALDEIMIFVKERRFCSDDSLKSDYPAIRTWAPSYGKEQPVKK